VGIAVSISLVKEMEMVYHGCERGAPCDIDSTQDICFPFDMEDFREELTEEGLLADCGC